MKKNYRITEADGSTRDYFTNDIYSLVITRDKNLVADAKLGLMTTNKDAVIEQLVDDLSDANNKMHCFKELINSFIQHNLLPEDVAKNILSSETFNEVISKTTSPTTPKFTQPNASQPNYKEDYKNRSI